MTDNTVIRTSNSCAECSRAVRIMARAVSWLQIKEAAFATHKGPAIIEEMQRFIAGNKPPADETSDARDAARYRLIRTARVGAHGCCEIWNVAYIDSQLDEAVDAVANELKANEVLSGCAVRADIQKRNAHSDAAVELAHARGVRIGQLEAELAALNARHQRELDKLALVRIV